MANNKYPMNSTDNNNNNKDQQIRMMSDVTSISMDTKILTQRLQSSEKSIAFIQREHASTLTNLHEEIAKWQQKCSDLTFQLAIGGTVINSTNDSKLRTRIEQLENELHQCQDKLKNLNQILEEKEKVINNYENRLIVNDRKHALELHLEHDKQRELKIELEQRSTLIAQLTNQLYRDKQHQQTVCNRVRLGQIILPNKPTRFKNNDEQQHSLSGRRLSNRSTSLHNRANAEEELTKVLFIGRRPPTPPQQLRSPSSKSIESNDEQSYTKRQCQLLNSHTGNVDVNKITSLRPSIKLSTILPPIVNRKIPLKALTTTTHQREGEA